MYRVDSAVKHVFGMFTFIGKGIELQKLAYHTAAVQVVDESTLVCRTFWLNWSMPLFMNMLHLHLN